MSSPTLLSQEVNLEEVNGHSSTKIYSHLSRNTIRTLRILPSHSESDAVECILVENSLLNPSPYKALSYTWGSKTDPGMIKLNGESFLVTQNLLSALTHLRQMGFDDALWIDALCTFL
jgi:hypothetical protein